MSEQTNQNISTFFSFYGNDDMYEKCTNSKRLVHHTMSCSSVLTKKHSACDVAPVRRVLAYMPLSLSLGQSVQFSQACTVSLMYVPFGQRAQTLSPTYMPALQYSPVLSETDVRMTSSTRQITKNSTCAVQNIYNILLIIIIRMF